MNIFKKIFKKKKKQLDKSDENQIVTYINQIGKDIESRNFISKFEYLNILKPYINLRNEINAISNSGMLDEYCKKKGFAKENISKFLTYFDSDILRQHHNDRFCSEEISNNKDYFDHILDELDSKIKLDSDQLRTIVGDEDNTLVIAGAGAGKTTTVAAKVKYLVDKKNISPDEILVISFTNKAVDELKDRINKKLKIKCDISTFHSIGSSIIYKKEDKKTIKEDGFLFSSIRDYLKGKILTDKILTNKIILFFSSYLELPPRFDMPLDEFFNYVNKKDFVTMRGELSETANNISNSRIFRNKTIKNETVASYQEVQIANFLYVNGIDYIYEDPYKFAIKGTHKIYTPDFHLFQNGKEAYLEHFGMVSDSGTNNSRSKEEIEKYINAIRNKIALHKEHGTTLLKTFGSYGDNMDLVHHLKQELISHGFELKEKTKEEIYNLILSTESNKYINRLALFIKEFISAFKTNGYSSGYFKSLRNKTKNERDKIFLDICEGAYNNYENDLKINNSIDFSDMINESVQLIREMAENEQYLKYKYIIVDEYQDISHQRYNLTKELSKICRAKIVAVGDDWQSIYAFSGSDITLFTEFKKNILDEDLGCELLYINNTYRNAQELIDIAGKFILKNQTQYTKTLKSPKTIENPVVIYSYCDDSKKIKELHLRNSLFQRANALEKVLDQLVLDDPSILNRDSGKEPILLIGRYGFDAEKLSVGKLDNDAFYNEFDEGEKEEYNIFDYNDKEKKVVSKKYPTLRMAYMTAHSSKGLTYDHVIIINGMNDLYGFPTKKEDDPIMDLVIRRDMSIEYAEERRLFYVALTRTSNRVYILAPETRPSEFVSELILDKGYKNVVVKGIFNETLKKQHVYYCPDCGFPLKRRKSNSVGIPLYICTNEHELCGFMTNDLKGGNLRILKCNNCLDGYLIVKKKLDQDVYFLGCINYKQDGTGCNETISISQFNSLHLNDNIKKYTLEQINDKTPLKFIGEEQIDLDTSYSVEIAIKTKEKSERNLKDNSALFDKIMNHANTYLDDIYITENDNKIAFIKNNRHWHWFWIQKNNTLFCYREKHKDEIHSIPINYESIENIYKVIDNLLMTKNSTPGKNIINIEPLIKVDDYLSCNEDDIKQIKKSRLFKELKQYRSEVAKADEVPPYVVMHDSTLIDICIKKPINQSELIKCYQFRNRKFDKYGNKILEIVSNFIDK